MWFTASRLFHCEPSGVRSRGARGIGDDAAVIPAVHRVGSRHRQGFRVVPAQGRVVPGRAFNGILPLIAQRARPYRRHGEIGFGSGGLGRAGRLPGDGRPGRRRQSESRSVGVDGARGIADDAAVISAVDRAARRDRQRVRVVSGQGRVQPGRAVDGILPLISQQVPS